MIGQEPIVTTLTNQIKLGRIGHAYLFCGSRGVGKTTCARIFARAVNCLSPVNGSPCGECEVCKKLASPDNVDIIEMDAASNNGVDDARDIREKVKYLPVTGKYKVYIIDEVHMLTGGAFNALLKTIEEPPEHVIFILATTEPQKLPQTILSRCIRFDFKLVPTDILAKHIAKVYDAEGIKYTADAAEEIARLGEGSVRDALSVADMLGSAADVITTEVVLSLTGASDASAISELFDKAAARDVAGSLVAIDALAASGKSMSAVCRQLVSYARNVLVIKAVGRDKSAKDGLVNLDKASFERLCASADKCELSDAARLLENFGAAENGIKYSVSPRLYLETDIVKLICGADEKDDLLRRVAAIERRLNSAPTAEQKKNIEIKAPEIRAAATAETTIVTPPPAPARADARFDYEPVPPPDGESVYREPVVDPAAKAQKTAPYPAEARHESKPALSGINAKAVDEGEFMHVSGKGVVGLELLGKVAMYLRKKGTPSAARARELLSRGVAVKERDDAIGFVVPDENFLAMTDAAVMGELDEALASIGTDKRARIEKTEEDLYADDLMRAKELFGKDNVIPKNG